MVNAVNSISGQGNIKGNEAFVSGMKSRTLETQLANQQQRLNKISGDSQMSEQEKAKERQKIEQQIAELNRKLRMEELKEEEQEQKAEKEQDSKIVAEEDTRARDARTENELEKEEAQRTEERKAEADRISPESVYRMLSVNSDIQMERVMERTARKKDGAENVLEAEIGLDRIRGTENPEKKEQLSEMRREKPFEMEILEVAQESNILGDNTGRKIIIREK